MKVDRKPSMGLPPPEPTAQCCVCNPRHGSYPGAFLAEEEVFCVVRRHGHRNKIFLGKSDLKGEITQKKGVLEGALDLFMHTKLVVSSFSRSRDTRVITGRITDRLTDQQTSPPDCILPLSPIEAGGCIINVRNLLV